MLEPSHVVEESEKDRGKRLEWEKTHPPKYRVGQFVTIKDIPKKFEIGDLYSYRENLKMQKREWHYIFHTEHGNYYSPETNIL